MTGHRPCLVCNSFLEQPLHKITNQKRYVKKPKSNSSKDKTDLLGDPEMREIFSGSLEELAETAQQFYSSQKAQHLGFFH